MGKIFISYAREDLEMAERVYNDLRAVGGDCWLDIHDLMPGQDWATTIRATIRNSNFFIAILSSRSVTKRGFIQKELGIAFDVCDEMPPDTIYFIPCRADNTEIPYPKISKYHRVDLFNDYDTAIEKLRRATNLPSRRSLSFEDFRDFQKLLSQNLVTQKLQRIHKIATDPAIIGLPTFRTEFRLYASRSLRRVRETLSRLQADLPIYNWTIEELGGNQFSLAFKHDQDATVFQSSLQKMLSSEGIQITDGNTTRNETPKEHSVIMLSEEPGEVSILTPEGRVVAFVNEGGGIADHIGGAFDAETRKPLSESELHTLLRNSNFTVTRTKTGTDPSEPPTTEPDEKIAPLAAWFDENGDAMTAGFRIPEK